MAPRSASTASASSPSAPALTLTSAEVAQLETALATALAPLDFARVEDWGAAVMASWRPLLTADQAFFAHSLDGVVVVQGDGARTAEAGRAYAEHFWTVDTGVTERRKLLGLEVYHRDDIYDRATFFRTEIGADWCAPNKLFDPLALDLEMGRQFPAALHFYHDRETGRRFGDRGLALLRLLLPAFKAGVQTHQRLAGNRAQLATIIDRVREGMILLDDAGRTLYRNTALEQMLADEPEPERGRLGAAILALGQAGLAIATARSARRAHTSRTGGSGAVSQPGPAEAAEALYRELRTSRGRYRMAATLLGSTPAGPSPASSGGCVLVSVESVSPRALSDAVLRDTVGLTTREIEVARLLARGLSTKEVKQALGVSAHTARHHTERVLAKLGVHSRAAVAAALQAG